MAGVLFYDRGQPVLFGKLFPSRLLAFEDAGPDDRPVVIVTRIEKIVEINRLMRPMEIADTEMQDAGAQAAPLIGRNDDIAGELLQRS
jgi:hypothetical protein